MKMCTGHKFSEFKDGMINKKFYYTISCDKCDTWISNGLVVERDLLVIPRVGQLCGKCNGVRT